MHAKAQGSQHKGTRVAKSRVRDVGALRPRASSLRGHTQHRGWRLHCRGLELRRVTGRGHQVRRGRRGERRTGAARSSRRLRIPRQPRRALPPSAGRPQPEREGMLDSRPVWRGRSGKTGRPVARAPRMWRLSKRSVRSSAQSDWGSRGELSHFNILSSDGEVSQRREATRTSVEGGERKTGSAEVSGRVNPSLVPLTTPVTGHPCKTGGRSPYSVSTPPK